MKKEDTESLINYSLISLLGLASFVTALVCFIYSFIAFAPGLVVGAILGTIFGSLNLIWGITGLYDSITLNKGESK